MKTESIPLGPALPGSGRADPAWYVADAGHGQRLLENGQPGEAAEVFHLVLARLGKVRSYPRAVMLERLGRCAQLLGHPDRALVHLRESLELAGRLDPSHAVTELRGTLRSSTGDVLRALGRHDDARKAYHAALEIARKLGDARREGVDLGRLGALARAEGQSGDALAHYREALARFQSARTPALEAVAWHELGAILHDTGQVAAAEHHYREAARVSESVGDLAGAARSWTQLALVLQAMPGRVADARRFAEAALAVMQAGDCTAAPVWGIYGLLATLLERQAAMDQRDGDALRSQAHDYRQLARHGPAIRGSLERLGPEASYGRAVILQRLGRCLRLGRRPDLALEYLRDALMITAQLTTDAAARALEPGIRREIGDALRDLGQPAEAEEQYASAAGPEQQPTPSGHVILEDEVRVEHVFEPDLLLESPVERCIAPCTDAPPLDGGLRPMLVPGVRTCPDEDGAIRCSLPWGEPGFERRAECTIIRRTRRAVVISSGTRALWQLLRHVDGEHTVAELLAELPSGERVESANRLAALAAAGVLDASGRAMGRFIHAATKKGVLAAGGLVGDDVLRLATDGSADEDGDGACTALSRAVPDRLRAFHALTRARRSRRDYQGVPLRRHELDALLHTACGITGSLAWSDRELKLRAYPSSGALYAVAIHPVALRVQGLRTAVYRYCARAHALELVRQVTAAELLGAALPVERTMLGGAAALICLSGRFRRHERKYGEGGYRMLVAEAGHISQNLILAATALGLSARPFGGVFDDLLNDILGLDRGEEQFLLAVVVGHAAGEHGAHS